MQPGADGRAQDRRQQGGGHALAHHVGDGDEHAVAFHGDDIEVIAADLARGRRDAEDARACGSSGNVRGRSICWISAAISSSRMTRCCSWRWACSCAVVRAMPMNSATTTMILTCAALKPGLRSRAQDGQHADGVVLEAHRADARAALRPPQRRVRHGSRAQIVHDARLAALEHAGSPWCRRRSGCWQSPGRGRRLGSRG